MIRNNKYIFDVEGDYKALFKSFVDELIKKPGTQEEKKLLIDELIESYIDQIGARPDGLQLQRLTNYLLADELKDRTPDKLTRAEFPIMSDRQYKTRSIREFVTHKLDMTRTRKEKVIKGMSKND